MPSFLDDDEPTSDFLADPDDELNQFKVRPHPVGAGPQSTIREIIAQSQPKPAVSPEAQTGGSPMLGSGGDQPMAAPDELRQGLDKFRTAQAHTQNVASWQPKPEEPKWWQRLASAGIGGAAGYVNAAGRTHVDPTAAIQGIQGVPGQQRKQAKWQSEMARAKEGEAAAGQDLNAVEHMRQLESGEKTAATTREHLAADTGFKKQQTKTLVDEGKRQPYMRVGDGIWDTKNQKWEKEPTDKSATIPIDAAWAKENLPFLVPDSEGHYSIPTAAAPTLVRTQTTPDPAAKENPNQWIADADSRDPAVAAAAQRKLAAARKQSLGNSVTHGSFTPIVDEQGNITSFFNAATGQDVLPPHPGRKTPLSPAENLRRAVASNTIEDIQRLEVLGAKYKDNIGPVYGRMTDVQLATLGNENPEVAELFRISTNLSDQLLRARSGAAITEPEYQRLAKLVPNPKQPYSTFLSNLRSYQNEVKRLTVKSTGGAVDAQGKMGGQQNSPPSTKSYSHIAQGANGHTIGSKDGKTWFDTQTGQPIK